MTPAPNRSFAYTKSKVRFAPNARHAAQHVVKPKGDIYF